MTTRQILGVLALCALSAWQVPALLQGRDGSHLLGRDPAQVLSEYGVPAAVVSQPSHLAFEYRPRPGRHWKVVFHDEVVVAVEGRPEPPRARDRVPLQGAYLGQSVSELVQRLGLAESVQARGDLLVLRFRRGPVITLRAGRVIAIEG